MATNETSDANANRTRWGGILLALGVIIALTTVAIADLSIPAPKAAATAAERAQRVVDNGATFEATGWAILYAVLLGAVGSFFLTTRPLQTHSRLPVSAFWMFTGVGLLLATVTTSWRIGAMVPLARDYANNPVVYDSLSTMIRTLGTIFTVAIVIGLVGVFWGEARAANAVIPSWLSYTGLVFTAARLVNIGLSYTTSVDVRQAGIVLGYFTFYGSYLCVLALVARIGFPNLAILGARSSARADTEG